ncbi:MAG: hypothetical protein DRP52_02170 [Planctomycetota bacterium]|nr:MAG: hypothetical protein DRP52_02170 [Planctomycetota bacterium]
MRLLCRPLRGLKARERILSRRAYARGYNMPACGLYCYWPAASTVTGLRPLLLLTCGPCYDQSKYTATAEIH